MSDLIDKTDFPIFNDKSLVYLDSASTSQKPKVVLDTIKKVYEHSNANVHRALYDLGSKSTELYESSRETISKFINAPSSKEIIFTSGTTASINLLSYSLESRLKKDDEILISHMEHHANIVPWQQLSKRVGVKLKYLPLTKSGDIDLENSKKYFTDRTKIVSITHMSNVLGTINPIKKIAKMAKSIGAVYIIDGAQSVSHMPVDVQDLECDFLAFSGHKMLGPTGIGIVWGRKELLDKMDPVYGGGDMIEEVHYDKATWAPVPHKFEAGTPPYVEAIGLGAAIDYLTDLDMENVQNHSDELREYGKEIFADIDKINIIHSSAEKAGCTFGMYVDNVHATDLSLMLDTHGVAVRSGHHCVQPFHRKLGIDATIRATAYVYNDKNDLDVFKSALIDSIEMLS